MATVLVKLEPLDDYNPAEVPVYYTADYNILNIKDEAVDSLQSPDGGHVQKLEIKEELEAKVESVEEAESVSQRESQLEDNHTEEIQQQNGNKRPRLSVNEESLLRINSNHTDTGLRLLERPKRVSRGQNTSIEHSTSHCLEENLLLPPTECPTVTSSRCQENSRDNGAQVSRDSLKMFFDAMYQDTKTLPLHLQIRTKRILFQAVADAQDMSGVSRPPLHNLGDLSHSSSTSRRVSSSGQGTDFNNPCC